MFAWSWEAELVNVCEVGLAPVIEQVSNVKVIIISGIKAVESRARGTGKHTSCVEAVTNHTHAQPQNSDECYDYGSFYKHCAEPESCQSTF